jgi:hypothetical protein
MSPSMDRTIKVWQDQVRMGSTEFFPPVIDIKEGQSITLFTEDIDETYTIVSGRWEDLELRQSEVPDTLVISEGQVVDETLQIIIGPFDNVGRFEFCYEERESRSLIVYVHEE